MVSEYTVTREQSGFRDSWMSFCRPTIMYSSLLGLRVGTMRNVVDAHRSAPLANKRPLPLNVLRLVCNAIVAPEDKQEK